MIEVENLTKFCGPTAAIQDVSFRVERGQIVDFLGPNGAGKTTTLRILAGYLPATSGTARVAGFDVFKDSLAVRRRLGYLPENVPLYSEMRVRTYLDFVTGVKNTPLGLRDKRLVAFETKDVKGIRLVWPDVTIAVEKDGDNWKLKEPQAAEAESGKALDLLYSLSGLRFKEIATEKTTLGGTPPGPHQAQEGGVKAREERMTLPAS